MHAADDQPYSFSPQSHAYQAAACARPCKVFGRDRTKCFHVKLYLNLSKEVNEERKIRLRIHRALVDGECRLTHRSANDRSVHRRGSFGRQKAVFAFIGDPVQGADIIVRDQNSGILPCGGTL
jgi:hypothetical protein